MHSSRGIRGFLYSRKMPCLYHTLRTGHDRFLAHSFHLYIITHSPIIWLSATVFTRYSTASFAASVFIFIPMKNVIPFVSVIQMFVLHRMTLSILKTFFGLSAYLAEDTVSRNNSYWVLTSFVAMATAVHTRISDKEILKAKLRTAEPERGKTCRSVGRSPRNNAATKSFRC